MNFLARFQGPRSSSEPAVVFVHVPRTGGTTLDGMLYREYGGKQFFPIYVRGRHGDTEEAWNKLRAMSDEERARIRCVAGHQVLGEADCYFPNSKAITILREPLARMASYYDYVVRNPMHYLHPLVVSHRMHLRDLMSSCASVELDNGQVRQVGGHHGVGVGELGEQHLEVAKERLMDSFCAFGITERYEESVSLIADVLGWTVPVYVATNGAPKTGRGRILDDETREVLERTQSLDLQLYAFAKEEFERRARRAPELRRRVSALQRRNRVFEKVSVLGSWLRARAEGGWQ